MKKLKWPTGLIRYSSYNGILDGLKLRFTPRIVGYTSILLALLIVTNIFLFGRSPVETTILRTPGLLYQETDSGNITNLYNIKIINKTQKSQAIELKLKSPKGTIRMVGGELVVPEQGLFESAFFVDIPITNIYMARLPIYIEVYSGEELLEEIRSSFIGPDPGKKIQ
jgi:polyferredoxin